MRPEVSHSARSGHKLVWHDKLGAMVMVSSGAKDLWVYETAADRWTEVRTLITPPCGGATTYDAAHDRLVLFTQTGETWVCKIERVGKN